MIPDNTPGSCQWITSCSQFETWHDPTVVDPKNPVLCIYGRSGTGKTVIAKYVSAWLREKAQVHKPHPVGTSGLNNGPAVQVISYFFDARSATRNSTIDVIRSLIYQLLSNDGRLFQFIYGTMLWEGVISGTSGFDSLTQCLDLCENMMKDPMTKALWLVIDALDECRAASRPALFDLLTRIRQMSKIRILVTSREAYPELQNPIPIDLDESSDHSSKDINLYINLEVNKLALRRRLSPELREEIRETPPTRRCLK